MSSAESQLRIHCAIHIWAGVIIKTLLVHELRQDSMTHPAAFSSSFPSSSLEAADTKRNVHGMNALDHLEM